MDTDPPPDVDFDPTHQDAEAALEALRAAISQPGNVFNQPAPTEQPITSSSSIDPPSFVPPAQQQTVERGLASILQLSVGTQTVLESMDRDYKDLQLVANVKVLVDNNRKIGESVKGLQNSLTPTIDPNLYDDTVPRADYDALKLQYDTLLATKQSRKGKGKKAAAAAAATSDAEQGPSSRTQTPPARGREDSTTVRKQRSIKLEHLVHKLANRRLGVQYGIQNFETRGSRDLPEPSNTPPTPAESINGIQEFRPHFRGEASAPELKPYIDQVVDDCMEAWESGGVGADDIVVDRKKMEEAVATYWVRLCKRWEEQQARTRGEVHKDELTRRKQNQYRRQQSLLARRLAAFDQSPLNLCKLRALYRSLLTIDFVPATQEKPDPRREYTENEWLAYQKLANNGRAPQAHEIVDIWWLSTNVRTLLHVLDAFALDQATRIKRKGKPKQPAPTFHLPPELWDRGTLPTLRPKDENGLPSDKPGIILFRFHVDEQVQLDNPDWAEGLYDNPPISETDAMLPTLDQVMNTGPYLHLKPRAKRAREVATVELVPKEEIDDVLARPIPPEEPFPLPDPDAAARDLSAAEEFMSQNLEAFEALAHNPLAFPELNGLGGALLNGPSQGSSVRARKQNKRAAREMPGGAAMPVAKKRFEGVGVAESEGEEVKVDLDRDGEFLQSLL